jgi:hypothetical protein
MLGGMALVMSQLNLWRGGWNEMTAADGPAQSPGARAEHRPGPVWNAGMRLDPEGAPQLAVRVGF